MNVFETIVIAIVEGLTEFLPVSSTGHMIIAQNLLGVESTDFVKAFTFWYFTNPFNNGWSMLGENMVNFFIFRHMHKSFNPFTKTCVILRS